ncbi:hypothetical protein Tco_0367527 [Tanacetum coccineum]
MWKPSRRLQQATRYKGKEIAKPITPPSESASEEDSDPEQAQKDKDMQKNLALILQSASKSSTNLPTPTSETPQNTKKQECGYYSKCNSRWDTVPLNCNEFGHFAKECRKPKLEQSDLASRHRMRKIDVTRFGSTLQSYMAKIQEVPNADSGTDAEPLEQFALQNKHKEFERYKAFNDRTVDYDQLERKLNETLGLLAQKDIDIQEGLKVKAYEISVVQAKHDELVKQSLLTRSHYEGLVKEKTKVITDLKLKEEKDIDKMISMEHQLKFLNEIVYKRSQSIQTIHMLAPKCSTFNGRPTFANPMYLKKAQNEHPGLYAITKDQSDPAIRLIPDREEILTLAEESRSKLNKDLVKPFDYTKLNSLYEIFKPPAQA